mgnify:CR=1 FL=1
MLPNVTRKVNQTVVFHPIVIVNQLSRRGFISVEVKEFLRQIGTGDRSERIRTYNFPQGRVTDHRINLTLHKLDDFLSGEIHEEMNQELRLKEQDIKLKNLN